MEQWKDILGFEGVYQVSTLGRVKRLKRMLRGRRRFRAIEEHFLHLGKNPQGYHMVPLSSNGIHCTKQVGRLVAMAFIPNPKNKPTVNHINSIRHDNRVENLEWATYSENNSHACRFGFNRNDGENHPSHRLKTQDIAFIRESKLSGVELSRIFGVSNKQISKIRLFQRWKLVA